MRIPVLELCENWEVEYEENKDIFEWLHEDPRNEFGKISRELYIKEKGGEIKKAKRVYDDKGNFLSFIKYEPISPHSKLHKVLPLSYVKVSCLDVERYPRKK